MTPQPAGVRRELVEGPDGPLEVLLHGHDPAIVLLPSAGRGAEDFDDLATRLSRAGFGSLCPQPRGIGASSAPLDGLTLEHLATDVIAVVEALAERRVTVAGHAFGNRVARMVATRRPDVVDSVVLFACGGLVPPSPADATALRTVFDDELPDDQHLAAVRQAFFAPGNDPRVWADGWHPVVAWVQGLAQDSPPVEEWWTAGDVPAFVLQPEHDVIAVPDNAADLAERLGPRVTVETIAGAGHALLPEQPDAVAEAVLRWLRRPGH